MINKMAQIFKGNIDDCWFPDPNSKETKKYKIKLILEDDIELLNEIVHELRKEKLEKIKNKMYEN